MEERYEVKEGELLAYEGIKEIYDERENQLMSRIKELEKLLEVKDLN